MSVAEDDPRVEALVRDAVERRAQGLSGRERLVQCGFALALVGAVVILTVIFPRAGAAPSMLLLLLAISLVAEKVRFTVGAYWAAPVQLGAVPILLLAPPGEAVALLSISSVLAALPSIVKGSSHPDRIAALIADQWYAVAAALVIAAFAPAHPELSAWPIYLGALGFQFTTDTVFALARLRLAQGVPPALQLQSSLLLYAVDVALAPLGLLAAVVADVQLGALLVVLPLLGLLEMLGRERERRIQHALALSDAYRGSALLMGEMLEADDEYTGGEHTKGVVALALAVGRELTLDARETRELEFGALLHDIGKLRTPDEIINKPGKLTASEWEIVQRHPVDGQAMLDRIGGVLAEVGLVVRHHHERWDGGGYPDGIAGENIPVAARIISACDAYNAMTTNRSYRKALPVSVAMEELHTCSGTQFDPRVVKAVLAVVEREVPLQPSLALVA